MRSGVRTKTRIPDHEVVDANADAVFHVEMSLSSDIQRAVRCCGKLHREIELRLVLRQKCWGHSGWLDGRIFLRPIPGCMERNQAFAQQHVIGTCPRKAVRTMPRYDPRIPLHALAELPIQGTKSVPSPCS